MTGNKDKTCHESAIRLNEQERMDCALVKLHWATKLLGHEQPELAALLSGDAPKFKGPTTSRKED